LESRIKGAALETRRITEYARHLEAQLQQEIVWRKSFFPQLGLSVRHVDGQVVVEEASAAARESGVEVGDVLVSAVATHRAAMSNVMDYMKFVCDLPVDAEVNVEVLRRGRRQTIPLTPVITSFSTK
jgi:S1-C subfamily serine protease